MKPKVWAVILVASSCATLCCTNPRDGLKMSIHPQKASFKGGERIRFDVVFRAEGGTLCLAPSRSNFLNIEISRRGRTELIRSTGIGFCGTNWRMLVMPLIYPVLLSACLLDVGDCMGRFLVVPDGEERVCCIELLRCGDGYVALNIEDELYPQWADVGRFPSRGEYEIVATFKSAKLDVYPAPLFWKVYDQPATATVGFCVE